LSWGRALGLLGGLSTGQLNCCLPRMEEKTRERERLGYHMVKKFRRYLYSFWRNSRTWQTDRHRMPTYTALMHMHMHRAVKTATIDTTSVTLGMILRVRWANQRANGHDRCDKHRSIGTEHLQTGLETDTRQPWWLHRHNRHVRYSHGTMLQLQAVQLNLTFTHCDTHARQTSSGSYIHYSRQVTYRYSTYKFMNSIGNLSDKNALDDFTV